MAGSLVRAWGEILMAKISPRREYNDRYYEKNRQKILDKLRAAYKADPEKCRKVKREWAQRNKKLIRERANARYKLNPKFFLDKNRKQRYGTDGNDILENQGFRCAICLSNFNSEKPKSRHLDHDHITKKVRQWLCNRCNSMIGFAKDDASRLISGAIYLMRHA